MDNLIKYLADTTYGKTFIIDNEAYEKYLNEYGLDKEEHFNSPNFKINKEWRDYSIEHDFIETLKCIDHFCLKYNCKIIIRTGSLDTLIFKFDDHDKIIVLITNKCENKCCFYHYTLQIRSRFTILNEKELKDSKNNIEIVNIHASEIMDSLAILYDLICEEDSEKEENLSSESSSDKEDEYSVE